MHQRVLSHYCRVICVLGGFLCYLKCARHNCLRVVKLRVIVTTFVRPRCDWRSTLDNQLLPLNGFPDEVHQLRRAMPHIVTVIVWYSRANAATDWGFQGA